jgi:Plasmid replication region DNA-binding N-term
LTSYKDVRTIVQRLVAAGVQPSRKRVRVELGHRGNYQTIGQHIDQALAELGLPAGDGVTPDDDDTPESRPSDPGEADLLAALDRLAAAMAAVHALAGVTETGAQWLYRKHLTGIEWAGMTEVQRMLNTPPT